MSDRPVDARAAEEAAARYLEGCGYAIGQRNFATPFGEIDIVAVDGDTVVFVEVKARASDVYGPPEVAVDRRTQARLRRMAEVFVDRHHLDGTACRFDVVALTLDPQGDGWNIELFQNAF
jgi:putative endonuclease